MSKEIRQMPRSCGACSYHKVGIPCGRCDHPEGNYEPITDMYALESNVLPGCPLRDASKEIRAELRGQCKAAGWSIQNRQVVALLDEMDEKDAEIERLKRERDLYKAMYIKTAEGKCDADAKVGALERAIKLECKGSLRSICAKWQPFVGCDRCRKKPCHCHDCDEYQFDQARFEGGEAL